MSRTMSTDNSARSSKEQVSLREARAAARARLAVDKKLNRESKEWVVKLANGKVVDRRPQR